MLAFTKKPSIDCLELGVPKEFSSLINLLIKRLVFMGPVSFPNFQRVLYLTRPQSRLRVVVGWWGESLSLVQQKEILIRSKLPACVGPAAFGCCLVD